MTDYQRIDDYCAGFEAGQRALMQKVLRAFKLTPRYPHKRSDGLTKRQNSGSKLQTK